jgi:hypothetical protein
MFSYSQTRFARRLLSVGVVLATMVGVANAQTTPSTSDPSTTLSATTSSSIGGASTTTSGATTTVADSATTSSPLASSTSTTVAAAATGGYAKVVKDDGALSHWRFDDASTVLKDTIGARNGTYAVPAASRVADGAITSDPSKALLNPSGGYGASASAAGLPSGNEPRSIEAWLKTSGMLVIGMLLVPTMCG